MRNNYASLADVRTRALEVRGVPYRLQCNPARLVSSSARTDSASVAGRRCFLCAAQRPPEQEALAFGTRYDLLVNPFPIFPRHLTVVDRAHIEQRIAGRFDDLLKLSAALTDYVVFYNGPRCGASAPDHAHFQAGSRGLLPIEHHWRHLTDRVIARHGEAVLHRYDPDTRRGWVIESTGRAADTAALFDAVYQSLPASLDGAEPMMNLLAWCDAGTVRIAILPRARHRPACYPAVLSSPASVDLGGVFILPQVQDFECMGADDVARILDEVCLAPADYHEACRRIPERLADTVQEAS